jgi:DNA-binding LytR/AlgR family response regulator
MNILIVEDERKTAALLREMVEQHPHCLVVGECQSIAAAVAYLQKHQAKIDLIFMDIQLADGDSFQVFRQVEVEKPVIFCTSYSEHTLKAFKNNGIDYILKPFRQDDIDAALRKVAGLSESLAKHAGALPPPAARAYQASFLVRFREKMIPVPVDDVALVFLHHDGTRVLRFNGETSALLKPIDEVEALVDPGQFFRINRQMLVNRQAVQHLEPYFHRKAVVNLRVKADGLPALVVSRLKVAPFKAWLEHPG